MKQLILTFCRRCVNPFDDFLFSGVVALVSYVVAKCESQGETHLAQQEVLMGYWLEKLFILSREKNSLGEKVRSIQQDFLIPCEILLLLRIQGTELMKYLKHIFMCIGVAPHFLWPQRWLL